jgi:hypothetical protein
MVSCLGKTTNGIHVYYVSDPAFHGTDSFSIEVVYPGHPPDIDTFTVKVLRRVSTDLCRDTSIILKIDAPLPAAEVRKPARSEWPENVLASKPARFA